MAYIELLDAIGSAPWTVKWLTIKFRLIKSKIHVYIITSTTSIRDREVFGSHTIKKERTS